ncbi:MAG: phenylacetate--CoA ligase family protein [Egibacteraceae bacterium]
MSAPALRPKRSLYPYLLGVAAPLLIEPLLRAPYLTISNWLRDFACWPPERRREYQQARLETVVRHAAEQVPFYRTALGRREVSGIRLTDLPVVDKIRLRQDMDAFRSEHWARMPSVRKRTSGTTGEPWQYPLDRQAWAHMYAAALHFWELEGYRYGERVMMLGNATTLAPGGDTLRARVRNVVERRVFAAAGLEVEHASSLQRALRATASRAALWYGYAGVIAAMAEAVAAEGTALPGPRMIVTTAEALRPEWRRRIEKVFGAPVFDQYGCNDGGILTQTCRHERFHVAESLSIVEILDGERPCPPGVEGDVTVTNLHARVLPFLRYKVGDRAVLGDGPCPCGRPGVTLERVAGRKTERLRLPDGTELSSVPIDIAFYRTRNVRRWQIVQTDPCHITIRLDVGPGYGEDEERAIVEDLTKMYGQELTITLATAEPITLTGAGKHPLVIRAFEQSDRTSQPSTR